MATASSANVFNKTQHDPFGMLLVGRNWEIGTGYKFGFNGQEQDDEVYGNGNLNTAEFWEYDSRLGRRWNVDPITKNHESPFAVFANNPLLFVDLNGADSSLYSVLTGKLITNGITEKEDKTSIWLVNENSAVYNPDKPWETAYQLKYEVGKEDGVSGKSLRNSHPLKDIGWNAGDPVYEEDLLDMTIEFNETVSDNIYVFKALAYEYRKKTNKLNQDYYNILKLNDWISMVKSDGPYDLKSSARNTYPEIDCYGAVYIGEFSIYQGRLMNFDDYGNIAYGAWGRAYDYDLKYLKRGAGAAQAISTGGMWDPQRDQKMIAWGYKNYFIFYNLLEYTDY